MRASTTLTTWMEETEAKSSCTESLKREGCGRHQKRALWASTLWVFIHGGAELKRETAKLRGVMGQEAGLVFSPGNLGLVPWMPASSSATSWSG